MSPLLQQSISQSQSKITPPSAVHSQTIRLSLAHRMKWNRRCSYCYSSLSTGGTLCFIPWILLSSNHDYEFAHWNKHASCSWPGWSYTTADVGWDPQKWTLSWTEGGTLTRHCLCLMLSKRRLVNHLYDSSNTFTAAPETSLCELLPWAPESSSRPAP